MSDARELIDAAIAEGRVRLIPTGETGIARKKQTSETRTRFHPDHCGKGEHVSRRRFLDEIDGDFQ